LKNTDDKKVERFLQQYESKARQALEYSMTHSPLRDMRVSFFAFLHSIGEHNMMTAALIKEVWTYIFAKGIDRDLDSSVYKQSKAKFPDANSEAYFRQAVDLARNPEKLQEYEKQHRLFQDVFQLFSQGLTLFQERRFCDAVRVLMVAHQTNEQLMYPMTKRQDIIPIIKVCLLAMYEEGRAHIQSLESIPIFTGLVSVLKSTCEENDPLMIYIREKFLSEVLDLNDALTRDKLERVNEELFSEERKEVNYKGSACVQSPKKLEPVELEALVKRTEELLKRWVIDFARHITILNEVHPHIFDFSIYTKPPTKIEGPSEKARPPNDAVPDLVHLGGDTEQIG